jgi:UDP-3-O-[3-hydroxymyristoyl] glucosamine N-acyltransferase
VSPKKSGGNNQEIGGEGASVLTAAAIAQLTGGRMQGDGNARVSSVAPLARARAGQLTFCASAKYAPQLAGTEASVVLLAPAVANAETSAAARIVVDQPQEAMLSLLPRLYRMPERRAGIHPTAVLGRGVRLGQDAMLGAHVHIGDRTVLGDRVTIDAGCSVGEGVEIGDDTHLFPGVTVYANSRLGRRINIHSRTVIGADGFGYVFRDGRHEKIPHVGRCVIEDDVEVGAGTTIDRGSIDDTVIGAGTKIDNLVMIAHNVRIGRLCVIAAQAGISGSVHIEDGVVVGGQAGFQGHHTIGKGAKIAGQSGVFGDVPAGETWSGYPARPHRESLRAQAALFRLANMLKRIERLLGRSDRDVQS